MNQQGKRTARNDAQAILEWAILFASSGLLWYPISNRFLNKLGNTLIKRGTQPETLEWVLTASGIATYLIVFLFTLAIMGKIKLLLADTTESE